MFITVSALNVFSLFHKYLFILVDLSRKCTSLKCSNFYYNCNKQIHIHDMFPEKKGITGLNYFLNVSSIFFSTINNKKVNKSVPIILKIIR